MPARNSIALFIAISLLVNFTFSGCSSGQAASPDHALSNTFPTIQSSSLNKMTLELPRDFPHTEVFVLLGFSHESKENVALWARKLRALDPQRPVYEMPVISGVVPGLLESVIRRGMKKKYSPEDQANIIPVFSDADKLEQRFTERGEHQSMAILLDKQRQIIGKVYGIFTEAKLQQLTQMIKDSKK
ncbi:MAG: hypothetical protein PHC51_00760 [bacterium]|nr:hypothetical protein [bacterium]